MDTPPERRDRTASEERPRIVGLETEVALLYLPDRPGDAACPPFRLLQDLVFGTLRAETKTATSSNLKGGYFLQNGGMVHFEIFLRHQPDTPILEVSTPECRSAKDLLVYSRALDRLLERLSSASRSALKDLGYDGCIAFGKNNRDARGVGFGCHENYLTYMKPSRGETVAFAVCLPLVLVLLLPALLVLMGTLAVYLIAVVVATAAPPLRGGAAWVFRRLGDWTLLVRIASAVYYAVANLLLLPAVWVYAKVLRLVAFRPLMQDLVPFLVTRQIFAGSGIVNFREGVFELSQRAAITSRLATIVTVGRSKTVIDLKSFLFNPVVFFQTRKRLSVTNGDSNLSDVPALLKVGATALVLEMIEDGERFPELRLQNPLRAFREVSRGGPWKEVRCPSGSTPRAIDVQRAYLQRAQRYLAGRPRGRMDHQETVRLWAEVLDDLEERPQLLADRLDWTAKKELLDRAVLASANYKEFFAWGRVFDLAGMSRTARASSLEDLITGVWPWRRSPLREAASRLDRAGSSFVEQRELYFQARKLDLRYHELGGGRGYQRMLEAEGLIRRLTVDEAVSKAIVDPPPDTRARIRGYYIYLSPSPDSLRVNWNEIELQSPTRQISLADPFASQLPGDDG